LCCACAVVSRRDRALGVVALSIEEPSSDVVAAGEVFSVAYACGGLACSSSTFVLKINQQVLHKSSAASPARLAVSNTLQPATYHIEVLLLDAYDAPLVSASKKVTYGVHPSVVNGFEVTGRGSVACVVGDTCAFNVAPAAIAAASAGTTRPYDGITFEARLIGPSIIDVHVQPGPQGSYRMHEPPHLVQLYPLASVCSSYPAGLTSLQMLVNTSCRSLRYSP
jgi:hypothetical protein